MSTYNLDALINKHIGIITAKGNSQPATAGKPAPNHPWKHDGIYEKDAPTYIRSSDKMGLCSR